jgi:putative chitinase
MLINRKAFFDYIRRTLFSGHLTESEVDGFTRILDYEESTYPLPLQQLAYVLATVKWETASFIQPIAEFGGEKRPYAPYYGRGLVQLTWETNYQKFLPIVGEDIVSKPDLAMTWEVALPVLFIGMTEGLFTSHKLADYFNRAGLPDDAVNARKIVNGTDHAEDIAVLYTQFLAALGGTPGAITPPTQPVPTLWDKFMRWLGWA